MRTTPALAQVGIQPTTTAHDEQSEHAVSDLWCMTSFRRLPEIDDRIRPTEEYGDDHRVSCYTVPMSNSIDSNAFDRVTDPVFRLLSRDQVAQIADYHGDESLQQRIEELAKKANEGELTDAEMAEYESYAHANKFVAILKIKAKRALDSST